MFRRQPLVLSRLALRCDVEHVVDRVDDVVEIRDCSFRLPMLNKLSYLRFNNRVEYVLR